MGLMDGKVVLISGGARGQGRSHAVTMAREGADIVVFDICEEIAASDIEGATHEDLEETVRLVEELDRRCLGIKADARDGEQVDEVVRQGLETFGKIDVVCVNHGIVSYGPTLSFTTDEFREMLDVNVMAVWQVCKSVVPTMVERGEGGAIVITSSGAGLMGVQNLGHYVASKHGALGLMRSLALELAPHMIRVNAVCPGSINTLMIHSPAAYEIFSGGNKDATWEDVAPIMKTQINKLPIEELDVSDISNAILYLASEQGRYVTGVALPVDAGAIMK